MSNDDVKFPWDVNKHEKKFAPPPKVVPGKCECGNSRFTMTHDCDITFYEDRVPNINFSNPLPVCTSCGARVPMEVIVENARKRANFKIVKDPKNEAPE